MHESSCTDIHKLVQSCQGDRQGDRLAFGQPKEERAKSKAKRRRSTRQKAKNKVEGREQEG